MTRIAQSEATWWSLLAFAVVLAGVCTASMVFGSSGSGLWFTVLAMALLSVASIGNVILIRRARRSEFRPPAP